MRFRLLAILILVLAPLPAGVGPASATGGEGCRHQACCEYVETVTCCGETVVERVCPRSGGACECVGKPADAPGPEREAPHPRPQRDTLTAIASSEPDRARGVSISVSERWPFVSGMGWRSGLTHNEIQASLGVWRT